MTHFFNGQGNQSPLHGPYYQPFLGLRTKREGWVWSTAILFGTTNTRNSTRELPQGAPLALPVRPQTLIKSQLLSNDISDISLKSAKVAKELAKVAGQINNFEGLIPGGALCHGVFQLNDALGVVSATSDAFGRAASFCMAGAALRFVLRGRCNTWSTFRGPQKSGDE